MKAIHICAVSFGLLLLAACGGGGGGGSDVGGNIGDPANCDGACTNLNLSVEDVNLVLQNGVKGAQKLGLNATFAVTDRVGNVLAVYQMAGAPGTTTVNGQIGAVGGLEGVPVPSSIAAISKAGTGAYLSSQGNAFTTRTASQIIQENFNPQERSQPGGPLFGVQFSQLICSDVTQRLGEAGGTVGPRPLPLGLSADPGGIPLYKGGDLVGGIGVELDGQYTLDRVITDTDSAPEEIIALYAGLSFAAPGGITAPNVNIGKSLRFTDVTYGELEPLTEEAIALDPSGFVAIPEYTDGVVRAGAVFGDPGSGVVETVRAGVPAAFLTNGSGSARFPTRGGDALPGGEQLSGVEVDALLDSVLTTAFRTRAAIRRPLDTAARVSIWVVDTNGNPLGFIRSQDAPIFGIDVALQKGRSSVFLSSADAGAQLSAIAARNGLGSFEDYTGLARAFVGGDFLTGATAMSDRSIGNLARPFFPDGIDGNINGPFSLPFPGTGSSPTGRSWSPFNNGLQLDLVFQRLVGPLLGAGVSDTCVDSGVAGRRLANGLQIFAGGIPIYRGGTLIGGVGISGDGIDQDDLIAFFGSSRDGLNFIGRTDVGDPELGFNAPKAIRSDNITTFPFEGVRLRYVNCPEGPFSGSNDQKVCDDA